MGFLRRIWERCPEFRKHFSTVANFTIDQNLKCVKFLRDLKIEGLKQALKPGQHILSVLFWILMCIAMISSAFVFAGMQISEDYQSPVEIRKTAMDKPIGRIPASAITICNNNHVRRSAVTKAQACLTVARNQGYCVMEEVTWTFLEAVELNLHIDHRCNFARSFSKTTEHAHPQPENEVGLRDVKEWVKGINVSMKDSIVFKEKIEAFLNKGTQNCSHLVPICSWAGSKAIPCDGHFYPVETDAGRCCVYNMLPEELMKKHPGNAITDDVIQPHSDIKAWNSYNIQEDLLANDGTPNVINIPRRQNRAGKRGGITFILNPDMTEQFCASHDAVGFKVAVHPQDEIAEMGNTGRFVPVDSETQVAVTAGVRLARDADLEFVDLEKRGCYMPNENPTQYYNNYTKNNCINECIANLTSSECKCLMARMPRPEIPKYRKLCGPMEIECVERVKTILDTIGLHRQCPQCLNRCNEVQYQINDVTSLPMQKQYKIFNNETTYWANDNVTMLTVFLIDPISTWELIKTHTFGNSLTSIGAVFGFVMDITLPKILQVLYALLALLMGILMVWIRKLLGQEVEDPAIVEPLIRDAEAQTDEPDILPAVATQTTCDVGTQTVFTTASQTTSDVSAQTTSTGQITGGNGTTQSTSANNGQSQLDRLPTIRITIEPTSEDRMSENISINHRYLAPPTARLETIVELPEPTIIRVQSQTEPEQPVVVNRRSRIPIPTRLVDPEEPEVFDTTTSV